MTADLERKQERTIHEMTARHLAAELRLSERSVREVYEAELQNLQRAARIRQFLPVLTAKHIKARYRHQPESVRAG
jgi:hypothetical protein